MFKFDTLLKNELLKRICLVATFVLIFIGSLSAQYYYRLDQQKIDSLEVLLPLSKDTSRIDILNNLAELYTKYNTAQYKKHIQLADSLSKKANYTRGKGMALYNYGQAAYLEGDYLSTIDYYHRAINLFEAIGDIQNLAKTNQQMAIALFFSATNQVGAIDYLETAIEQYRACGDLAGESIACFNLAGGLLRLGLYEDGMGYIQKYLQITDSIGDFPIVLGTGYALLGNLYAGLADYKNAIRYYHLSIETYDAENIEDRSVTAGVWGYIGALYENNNLPDSAFFCYKEALKLNMPILNAYNRMYDHFYIGRLYAKLKNMDMALPHFDSSLYFARMVDSTGYYYQIDSLKNYIGHSEEIFFMVSKARRRFYAWSIMLNNYQSLYNIYLQTGQYKKAAELHTPWMEIQDSINNYQRAKEQKDLQMRYETEKKEQQLQQLSEENKFKVTQLEQSHILAMGLGVLLIMIILLAIILIRQNKLKSSQQTLLLQQRLFRTQMNPHFIFNSLSSIQGFMIEQDTKSAGKYLTKFAKLIRNILDNSTEEYVSLDKEISTIENYLALQKVRYHGKFDYTIEIDETINQEVTRVPPMLAQPFIENCIEHGFKQSAGKGHIQINILQKDSNLFIQIEDNGIGREAAMRTMNVQSPNHKSMATQITRQRITALNKKLKKKIKLDIVDLKDEQGGAKGTRVVFKMLV